MKKALILTLIALGSVALATWIALGNGGNELEAGPAFPPLAEGQADGNGQAGGDGHPLDDGDPPELEFSRAEAVGFSTVASNLARDIGEAPFLPLVAQYVPEGLALERYNLMAFGDEATLDLLYTVPAGSGVDFRPAVHVWQTNRAYEIPAKPAQSSDEEGTLSIDGRSWSYWLLSYPQPDGRVLKLYDAETTTPGGISFTVDIRVGLDPSPTEREEAFAELEKVLGSLAPLAQQ